MTTFQMTGFNWFNEKIRWFQWGTHWAIGGLNCTPFGQHKRKGSHKDAQIACNSDANCRGSYWWLLCDKSCWSIIIIKKIIAFIALITTQLHQWKVWYWRQILSGISFPQTIVRFPQAIVRYRSRCQSGGFTTVMYTSQHIFVFPWNGKGIIYVSITALLVLEKEIRVIECCQFAEAKIIVSVNAPIGYCCGEFW